MNYQADKISVKKFNSKKVISFRYSNLYQVSNPQIKRLSKLICQDRKGGKIFRENLLNAGILLGMGLKDLTPKIDKDLIAVIGIPRGGTPLAEGICKSIPKSKIFYTNDGKFVNFKKPLLKYDDSLQKCQLIIVADTVIDLGVTAERTLKFLINNYARSDIVLVSLITSLDGAYRLEKTFPKMIHYTSMVEKNTIWVKVTENLNRRIIPKIGDVGELVGK